MGQTNPKIGHFFGTSETAVRIQITVALIAFLLLRFAHDANKIVKSPLAFARLIKTNLMQRRALGELLKPPPRTAASPTAGRLRPRRNTRRPAPPKAPRRSFLMSPA